MPNKYKYDVTFEDRRDEEDREALNDFYRDQSAYYKTLDNINNIFLKALKSMSDDEIREILKHKYIVPVNKLK